MSNHIIKTEFAGNTIIRATKELGSFHPKREDFKEQIMTLLDLLNATHGTQLQFLVAQNLGMGPNVVHIAQPSQLIQGLSMQNGEMQDTPGFYRPPYEIKADSLIFDSKLAWTKFCLFVVFNADSPISFIQTPDGFIAIVHTSFRGVNPLEQKITVIANTVNKLAELSSHHPADFIFNTGYGTEACCFGHDAPQYAQANQATQTGLIQLIGPSVIRNTQGQVIKGPRTGGFALSITDIAAYEAAQAGISPENISITKGCTACGDMPSFSNLYTGAALERSVTGIFVR